MEEVEDLFTEQAVARFGPLFLGDESEGCVAVDALSGEPRESGDFPDPVQLSRPSRPPSWQAGLPLPTLHPRPRSGPRQGRGDPPGMKCNLHIVNYVWSIRDASATGKHFLREFDLRRLHGAINWIEAAATEGLAAKDAIDPEKRSSNDTSTLHRFLEIN